jgi:hypothetical protein
MITVNLRGHVSEIDPDLYTTGPGQTGFRPDYRADRVSVYRPS